MNFEVVTALVIFAFVSSITPGPNNIMLLASGTNYGFRRTVPHMLGVAIGFTVMVVLVGIGLMQLFDAWPLTYTLLKYASIGYLLYLSWKIATAGPAGEAEGQAGGRPFTFVQASLFQWVNPKAWTMALTAISAYTPPNHPFYSVLIVALVFGLVNLPSVATWVLAGTRLRLFLADPVRLRVFNVTAALLLVGSLYPVVFS